MSQFVLINFLQNSQSSVNIGRSVFFSALSTGNWKNEHNFGKTPVKLQPKPNGKWNTEYKR